MFVTYVDHHVHCHSLCWVFNIPKLGYIQTGTVSKNNWKSYSIFINAFQLNCLIKKKFLTYADHHTDTICVGFPTYQKR